MIKRINIISVFILILTSFLNLHAEVEGQDSLVFTEIKYDFGEVKQGEVVEHVFTFENLSSEPVLITKVVTQCGCTAPEYSKEQIAPQDTGEILIKFDSKDKLGYQRKTIKVKTSTGESVKLIILVNII